MATLIVLHADEPETHIETDGSALDLRDALAAVMGEDNPCLGYIAFMLIGGCTIQTPSGHVFKLGADEWD